MIRKDDVYYIVQYKKDPSFFGLIKHDWKSVYYNAEELARRYGHRDILLEPLGTLYSDKDVLVPNLNYAKILLSLTKHYFSDDPVASSVKVVYQEETTSGNSGNLANAYNDLITK